MRDYYIALLGTLFVFFVVQTVKNIRRFNLLNRIKRLVLIHTTRYLIENRDGLFAKHQFRNYIYRKLEEEKVRKWVDGIDLEWVDASRLIISFEMVYSTSLRMRFEYPMNLDDLRIRNVTKDRRSV